VLIHLHLQGFTKVDRLSHVSGVGLEVSILQKVCPVGAGWDSSQAMRLAQEYLTTDNVQPSLTRVGIVLDKLTLVVQVTPKYHVGSWVIVI
jgi:hypothetical protein